jgi:hypothetical protein
LLVLIKLKFMGSRFFLPSITGLFFLLSCGSENQPAEPQMPELQDTITGEIDAPFLPGDTVKNSSNIDSLMDGFPKHWVQVERKGKDLVYTDYCSMETPQLKIEKTADTWQITTMYGHDAELWQVLDMMKSESSVLGQELVEGQFIVKKLSFPDDEIYHSNFFWNKTGNTCTFGDFFAAGTMFADQALKKTFVIKEVPCDF